MKNQSELAFEKEVIDYLTQIGGVKQWDYKKDIKTTEQLWNNFKTILEQNNHARLDEPLSTTEFNQVKKVIMLTYSMGQVFQLVYLYPKEERHVIIRIYYL